MTNKQPLEGEMRRGASCVRDRDIATDEKNPQIETLIKISAAIRVEFAIDVIPAGQEPKLVRKAVRENQAQGCAGVSLLVAAS